MDDEATVDAAERILSYLKSEEIIHNQAVILVANKTDLVRSRIVSTSGRCKISTDINFIQVCPHIVSCRHYIIISKHFIIFSWQIIGHKVWLQVHRNLARNQSQH